MGRFLRDNAAVVVGLGLPVAVVVLFLLASHLPALWTEPPGYDLLLEVENGPVRYPAGLVRVEVYVDGDRVRARLHKIDPDRFQRSLIALPPPQQLYLWSHDSGVMREVALAVPTDLDAVDDGAELPLGELAGRRISTSPVAPDGYELAGPAQGRDGLFGLFFGGRSGQLVLAKDGARVAVDLPPGVGYWNVHFLGWVVE
ncbi:MAG TPA: hypothetical protein VIN61_01885 [Gammaproteobacteria bacterium]